MGFDTHFVCLYFVQMMMSETEPKTATSLTSAIPLLHW